MIHAWGDSLREAFEQCATAMFGYMTELEYVEMREVKEVEAEGHDMLSLLFHFLDECLFLFCDDPFFIVRVRQAPAPAGVQPGVTSSSPHHASSVVTHCGAVIHSSINLSIYPYIHQSIHLYIHQSIHTSISPSPQQSELIPKQPYFLRVVKVMYFVRITAVTEVIIHITLLSTIHAYSSQFTCLLYGEYARYLGLLLIFIITELS
ncbi:uncharacterized protein LOC134537920 isoform X2 [Bacillus rossius redtenbacheri]|uniref:uncharacterized protein LOC134537920 isoform X2 n=1 Tax=Bacillus rossius redtenbacheri TaxID=93214 RepID=UPI002FDE1419